MIQEIGTGKARGAKRLKQNQRARGPAETWRRGWESNPCIKVLQTSPLTTWVPRLIRPSASSAAGIRTIPARGSPVKGETARRKRTVRGAHVSKSARAPSAREPAPRVAAFLWRAPPAWCYLFPAALPTGRAREKARAMAQSHGLHNPRL